MARDEESAGDRGYSDDDDDSTSVSEDDRRHKKKTKEKKKKSKSSHHHGKHKRDKKSSSSSGKEKKKKKDRKRKEYYSESDSRPSDDDDEESYKRRRKDRKRRRKESTDKDGSISKNHRDDNGFDSRNQKIIHALYALLQDHPNFASELPLILIRLAGGTTFDLQRMTEAGVALGLHSVFVSLESFGVKQDVDSGMWMFQNPPGASRRRDELVLLRVIRALMDEAGLSMDGIAGFEEKQLQRRKEDEERRKNSTSEEMDDVGVVLSPNGTLLSPEDHAVKEFTFQLLAKFQSNQDTKLGPQLAGLCNTIAVGEIVSIDGLPDERLKDALEGLFRECGLVKSEMEDDGSDDDDEEENGDDNDAPPVMGYGLPEGAGNHNVQGKLAAIMAACREGPPKKRAIGPMRKPTEAELAAAAAAAAAASQKQAEEEEDEDGPLLPGAAARTRRGPTLPLDEIKAQAEHRELELRATAAGVPMPSMEGGREEWMIIPGKYDFMEGIKSGHAMKSRGFKNKKSRDDEDPDVPIHPAMQAEMDAIMKAHQDARGPSLMDQHRAAKQKEKQDAAAAANSDGRTDWKWNRDKDLDAGRRVDKDALGMILGGAADNLKTKFSGGFNR